MLITFCWSANAQVLDGSRAAVTSFPFIESFEDDSPTRASWTQIQENGNYTWSFTNGAWGDGNYTAQVGSAFEGTRNARFKTGSNRGYKTKLVSPVFDLTTAISPRMAFYLAQEKWGSSHNKTKIYYKTGALSPWVEIANYPNEIVNWTSFDIELPNPTATYQIAFEGINDWGFGIVIDLVKVYSSSNPGVVINTPVLEMGHRPIGAWMEPARLSITNNPGNGDAIFTAADINNNYNGFLTVATPAFPFELEIGESTTEFGITTSNTIVSEGDYSGTMAVMYSTSRSMATVDYNGHAYIPTTGDVWEKAEIIGLGDVHTIANTGKKPALYKNYILPNDLSSPDVYDYVGKIILTNDAVLNVTPVSGTVNVVIYNENFNGEGGPMAHNALYHSTSAIVNYPLFAGTYYIVGSGDAMAQSNLTITDMPAPVAATYTEPLDGAIGISNNQYLKWTFGDYTDEYQVLVGTTYPPATVVVPWTSNLANSYKLTGLQNNMQYFWQVNVRNTNGTTNGDVWGFTTTLNVPQTLTATVVDGGVSFPTVTVNLNWTGETDRAIHGYNVYKNGVKINSALLTESAYIDNGVARNASYTYTVTAVYDEGESSMSNSATATVKGVGTFNGTVTDFLTNGPVANARIDITGPQGNYTVNTESNGTYNSLAYAGTYRVDVAAAGYTAQSVVNKTVAHNGTSTNNFVLMENPAPVTGVTATLDGSDVSISWSAPVRGIVNYSVYREKVYQVGSSELLGTTTQTSLVDFNWDEQSWGVYRWYVVVNYDANQTSAPAYSNTLEQDMTTTVNVAVILNSNESAAGAMVTFDNISEPGLELSYEATLTASGTYEWRSFRKGSYNIEVSKAGYESVSLYGVNIYDPASFAWTLIEAITAPLNLYVTPTGLATWDMGGNAPLYQSDLEANNGGWVAGGTPAASGWVWGTPAKTVLNRAFSGTKAWVTGGLTANYESGSNIWIAREFDFSEAVAPVISAQLFLQTEKNWDGMILESSIDGGATWQHVNAAGLYNGTPFTYGPLAGLAKWTDKIATDYALYEGSLSDLAGNSSVWLRFRFASDGSGNYNGIAIDNITIIDAGQRNSRELESFKVFHSGVLVADLTETTYQYGTNGEALVDGTSYLAEVTAVYSTGQSERASYNWTYIACDNYPAPANFAANQVLGTVDVNLTWTVPTVTGEDQIDFARIYRDGIVIDEVTTASYLDEDLAFGEYEYCITFVYESGAETCPATICDEVEVIGGGFVNGNVKQAAYLGGANIEGAQVTLSNANNTFTFTTNASGDYNGEVIAGTYNYSVAAEGYVSAALSGVVIAQTATVTNNFVLMEYPYAVNQVVATEVNENTVLVNWGEGGGGSTEDFFEGFEAGTTPTGWLIIDQDGDSYKWENTAITYNTFEAHTGAFCMTSASYINEIGALTPNNWLITPAMDVTANSELRFWFTGQDPDWAAEKMYVRISTTGTAVTNFTETVFTGVATGNWAEGVVDLSNYAGQTIYIAFVHADITDMYFLKLDDVTVTATATRAAYTEPVIAGVSKALPFKAEGMSQEKIQVKSAEYAQTHSSRELTGYEVYRTTCATGEIQFLGLTLDQTFTDNTWGAATSGVYKWGVVAVYEQNESEIVFSNCIDKDMITNVSVNVITNSQDSPEGTDVIFTNMSEPELNLVYETELDETGHFAWDEFRKGTYDIYVEKSNFQPVEITGYVIDGPEAFEWILDEMINPVADLHVSPTGYATWRDGGVAPFEPFFENFDSGVPATWTITDGGSSTDTWYNETPAGNPQSSGASLDGTPFMMADSDEAGSGVTMNEVLTSPVINASTAEALYLEFDQYYNNLSSTTEYTRVEVYNGSEWIQVLNQTTDQGAWNNPNHQVIDVTEYANEEFQVRFTYYSTGWNWYWTIDNVAVTDVSETRSLEYYKVWLDGIFVTDTQNTYYQYDPATLTPGQEYFSEVAAMYSNGMSVKMNYTWTYFPCDSFPGPEGLDYEIVDNNDVVLNWGGTTPPPTGEEFFEGFEGAFPPAGWAKINPDGGTGWVDLAAGTTPVPGWTGGTATAAPEGGAKMAFATWETGGLTSNDQWIVTPQITVEAGSVLAFHMRYDPNTYIDKVDVKISTTSQTSTSAFNVNVATINLNSATSTEWILYTYDLTDFVPAGTQVYIAFRENVADNYNDGSAVFLDNVYVGPPTTFAAVVPSNNNSIPAERDLNYRIAKQELANALTDSYKSGSNTANSRTSDLLWGANWETPQASVNGIISTFYGGLGEPTMSADDFTVPAGEEWTIETLMARGFLSVGAPEPQGFGYSIYRDNNGEPGTLVTEANITGSFDVENVEINLATPVTLEEGKYWLGIYAYYATATGTTEGRWNQYMWNPSATPENPAMLNDFADIFGMGGDGWNTLTSIGVAYSSLDFAIHGTSSTGGGTGGGTFDPGEFLGASVYRNGELIAEGIMEDTYTDMDVEPGYYDYCVVFVYENNAMSCMTNCVTDVLVTEDCIAPTGLTTEVNGSETGTALLTWNNFAGLWLSYGDLVYADAIGLTDFSPITVAIQFDPADLAEYGGKEFSKMRFYYGTGSIGTVTAQIWEGTTLVMEQTVNSSIVGESWNTVEYSNPVIIDATKSYRIGYTVTGYDAYPAGAQNFTGDMNSDLVYMDGAWDNLSNYLPYSWLIETFVSQAGDAVRANEAVVSSVTGYTSSAILASAPSVNTDRTNVGRSANRAFLGYNIYRDGVVVNTEPVLENTYLDTPGVADEYCYTVTALYEYCGETEASNEACIVLTNTSDYDLSALKVYPNPSNSNVTIELTNEIRKVVLYNYAGQMVEERNINKDRSIQIDVRNYEAGAYLVRFITNSGESYTKKLAVSK